MVTTTSLVMVVVHNSCSLTSSTSVLSFVLGVAVHIDSLVTIDRMTFCISTWASETTSSTIELSGLSRSYMLSIPVAQDPPIQPAARAATPSRQARLERISIGWGCFVWPVVKHWQLSSSLFATNPTNYRLTAWQVANKNSMNVQASTRNDRESSRSRDGGKFGRQVLQLGCPSYP